MCCLTVGTSNDNDLDSLIDLARSVEPLFGPMVGHGFEGALRTNMQRDSLFVARDNSAAGIIAGGLIFDARQAPIYHISWLAVFPSYRRRGVGRLLLTHALAHAIRPCAIEVVTFGADILAGMPARHLYESLGFQPGNMVARGPEGGSRQRYTLKLSG